MSKYLVAAVHQSSGNAKATGNPYAIPRANVLTPFQNRQSANQTVAGVGFSCIELTVSEHFYPELSKHFASNFKGLSLSRGAAILVTAPVESPNEDSKKPAMKFGS